MAAANPLPSGIVTFVFTDIEGSTRLLRRLGDRYAAVLERHRAVLRDAWQLHGGVEVETEGDAVLAAFADAGAAIAACADAQRALLREDWPNDGIVRVRMGVHSGLAYPRAGGYVALAVHQASRVVAAAHGGQVLVSEQTAELTSGLERIALASLGRFRLRDFDGPVRLLQVSGDGLLGEFQSVRALPAEGHNLVRPPTSFIGRDDSIVTLRNLLGSARIVSLVGPGGVGKTRLVTELGLQIAADWRDGVWFVDLSPLRDETLIAATVATAIGCSVAADAEPWQAVLDHLRQRRSLVIFDNCEHVIEAVARRVADLLRVCAEVGVLATSREPLGLAGEQVWRLAPLSTIGEVIPPAAQLFAARARAVRPEFQLDAASMPIVTAICNRLDGLPLAIELAAARVGVLNVAEILAGLEDRFRLLRNRDRTVPDRQRTLEALLDWSQQLLAEDERATLRRLGVFAGSFDLETAAAAVADAVVDAYDVPERVWSLAEKSLISVEPTANATRYRLFESIRAYAMRKLDEAGEMEATVARLADWYLERLGPWVSRSKGVTSLTLTEIPNLRGLVALLAASDQRRAQCLACAIASANRMRGTAAMGAQEIQSYLDVLPAAGAERVALLAAFADLLMETGQSARANAVADEAAALDRATGAPAWDPGAAARALSKAALCSGNHLEALRVAREALADGAGGPSRPAMLNQLSIAAVGIGELDIAYHAEEESLALDLQLGRDENSPIHYSNLAEIDYRRGDFRAAALHQRRALVEASQAGYSTYAAFSLIVAARLAGRFTQWGTAVRLHAKAESVLGELGYVMLEQDRRISGEILAAARTHLGDEEYEAEKRVGEQLSLPAAIESTDTVLRSVASMADDSSATDATARPMAPPSG